MSFKMSFAVNLDSEDSGSTDKIEVPPSVLKSNFKTTRTQLRSTHSSSPVAKKLFIENTDGVHEKNDFDFPRNSMLDHNQDESIVLNHKTSGSIPIVVDSDETIENYSVRSQASWEKNNAGFERELSYRKESRKRSIDQSFEELHETVERNLPSGKKGRVRRNDSEASIEKSSSPKEKNGDAVGSDLMNRQRMIQSTNDAEIIAYAPESHFNSDPEELSTRTKNNDTIVENVIRYEIDSMVDQNLDYNPTDPAVLKVTQESDQKDTDVISDHSHLQCPDEDHEKTNVERERRLLFRFPGHQKGAVGIYDDDLERLKPKSYLNDNLIDFYFKYVEENYVPYYLRKKTFFFNSFFYQKLSSSSKHEDIQRWAQNTELLEKRFILMPICESFHWSLAVICNPGRAIEDPRKVNPVNRAVILIFDSLASGRHNSFARLVRKYMQREWECRKQLFEQEVEDCVFDTKSLPVWHVKVPRQDNDYDCGLYLLLYTELFFRNPPNQYEFTSEDDLDLSRWFTNSRIFEFRERLKILTETMTDRNALMNARKSRDR